MVQAKNCSLERVSRVSCVFTTMFKISQTLFAVNEKIMPEDLTF